MPSGASGFKYLGRFWGFPFSFQLEGGDGAASSAKDSDSGKCVLGDTNPTSGDAKIEPSPGPSPLVAKGPSLLFLFDLSSLGLHFFIRIEIAFFNSSLFSGLDL